jgi:hypothetical protein
VSHSFTVSLVYLICAAALIAVTISRAYWSGLPNVLIVSFYCLMHTNWISAMNSSDVLKRWLVRANFICSIVSTIDLLFR